MKNNLPINCEYYSLSGTDFDEQFLCLYNECTVTEQCPCNKFTETKTKENRK
jgi:hypothetical protein